MNHFHMTAAVAQGHRLQLFRQAGSRLTYVTSAIPIGPTFVYDLPDHPPPAPDQRRYGAEWPGCAVRIAYAYCPGGNQAARHLW
jgi:hypothetical protein